jgi:hypothetical protein
MRPGLYPPPPAFRNVVSPAAGWASLGLGMSIRRTSRAINRLWQRWISRLVLPSLVCSWAYALVRGSQRSRVSAIR